MAPLGCQSTKPGADQLVDREEVELLAEQAVVAALGLLEAIEVRLELVFRGEGRAVDALELRRCFSSPRQ